jgi:hypothetical protein
MLIGMAVITDTFTEGHVRPTESLGDPTLTLDLGLWWR